MSSKCFVPNCNNTVGVSFPEDSDLKKEWLNSLKIKDVIPNQSSFICFDHFEEKDVRVKVDKEPLKTIKDGAIPTIISPQKHSVISEVSESLTDNAKKEVDNLQSENKCIDNEENHDTGRKSDDKQTTDVEDCNIKELQGTANKNMDDKAKRSDNIGNDVVPDVVMFNVASKICRLCGNEESNTKNIFEEKIENVLVSVAIMECIYPIEILENDKLSKAICQPCLQSLTSYFKFRSVCLENDKKQRDLYYEDDRHISEASESSTNFNEQKRKANGISCPIVDKKQRIEDHIYTDSEDDYSEQDELDSLSDFIIKSEVSAPKKQKSDVVVQPPPSVSLPRTQSTATVSKPTPTDIDTKFDKVEEELRRVLEGQLTEEQAQAENIIIHVENDEEEHSPDKVATLTKLKLPIVIKPISTEKLKKDASSVTSRRRIIDGDVKGLTKVTTTDCNVVTFPKGINISVKDNYTSEVGAFVGTPLIYVFNTEFCEVDGYLFEYRLCKGITRFLRCVLPACHALAVQNRVASGQYSTEVTVQKPHSHRRPNDTEKKKQMFYYVMKRKMQSDKTLNFRSVYDEVCESDPEIKVLVPLRNVINEICRHQLTYRIPQINSFDQFYSHIEDDGFQKLHFTHNGRQFYQEKFIAEDDSKAVVFANADIIDQVSYSNLMYVDASFKIDTIEDFKYQLVTVLVWVDDSYYPILYALVNRKTQEIYKKIFEYLHDTLAPKLRPDEIVTDYEANLYYALGETYLHSSIGGSVFYYTQNLYKKICTLNLSHDLETNSYFRNIYHMLLMLPLLPVNTILDGLNNIEIQARDLGLTDLTRAIFDHVRSDWIMKVTPDLFCVHRLENRINENVIAPFKKLRDFIMLSKGKMQKQHTTIFTVVEKLIELEHFLQITYATPNKKSFARDLSSSQKKNVIKAWQYIESHPKININNFFSKVLGYIKCMENQLWIWGFYRYSGNVTDDLINATNFSIVSNDVEVETLNNEGEEETEFVEDEEIVADETENGQVVMEAVIDENGSFVLQNKETDGQSSQFENAFFKYVYKS